MMKAFDRPRLLAAVRRRGSIVLATAALIAAVAIPARTAEAQFTVTGGDFDICDYCGTLRGNTAFLTGRPGFGTNVGRFRIVNANGPELDVDQDGFTPGVNFNNLAV